jgi:hypothetical protein
MEISLAAPGLDGRDIKVRAGGVLGRPRLFVDGKPARETRGSYRIDGSDGRSVEIRLVRRGDDPFPEIHLDGTKLPDVVEPFSWYHDLWVWIPFPVLCWFGAGAAFLGALAVTVNATLFRWARTTRSAYGWTALSSFLFVATGILLTREASELFAARMTWVVLFGN